MAPDTPRTHALSSPSSTMARPTSSATRNHQLNIALRDDEMARVSERAKAFGLRPVDFARNVLLNEKGLYIEVPVAAIDRLALEQLKRVGNSLNQIARQLNSLRQISVNELEDALREVRELIRRMA